jgi:hypothetical protein
MGMGISFSGTNKHMQYGWLTAHPAGFLDSSGIPQRGFQRLKIKVPEACGPRKLYDQHEVCIVGLLSMHYPLVRDFLPPLLS